MRRFIVTFVVGLAFIAAAGLAVGDIIKLNTGGRIVGKIVEEDETHIIVQTPTGRTEIMREDIESIERGGDPIDIYKENVKKIDDKSAKDHYQLGLWCKENKLAEQYEKHMLKAIELDPKFDAPHKELGYEFYHGKWMSYEDACEAKGWVKHEGRYYPPETAKRLEQGLVKVKGKWVSREALEKERTARLSKIRKYEKAAAGAKIEDIKVPEEIEKLLEMAKDPDPAKRLAAYEALYAKDKLAKDLLAKILFQERAKSRDKVVGYFKNNKSSIRSKLGKLIIERRAKAMKIIFDKTIYPDANHGRSGQPKVDEVVNALRAVYESPFDYYLEKSLTVKDLWASHKATLELVNKYTDARIKPEDDRKEISEEVGDILSMWKVTAQSSWFEVLAYNKTVKTTLTKEERACIDKTNWYRMMLGRRPLKIHEGLVQAARKHSECMKKNNFFAHDCRIHGSPAARCRREGAPFRGENIANGMKMGVAAFWGWYNSSGHHRNMLAGHGQIGVGNCDRLWTMDLG